MDLTRAQEELREPAVQIAIKMKLQHRLTAEEMWALADYLRTVKANNEQHLMQIAVKRVRSQSRPPAD